MNLSEIISIIKMNLGIYAIALPLENPDEAIAEVINLKTLKTFSIFQPYYEKLHIHVDQLQEIKKTGNSRTYLLPEPLANRGILFVRSIDYNDTSSLVYNSGVARTDFGMFNTLMLANASANLYSRSMPKMTIDFRAPRELTIYNLNLSLSVVLDIAYKHSSLATIAPTAELSFLELAELDVKMFLYNLMKHYTDLSSAYGTISLKLDDWSQAESERKQLIDQWSATYHFDVSLIEFI